MINGTDYTDIMSLVEMAIAEHEERYHSGQTPVTPPVDPYRQKKIRNSLLVYKVVLGIVLLAAFAYLIYLICRI